VDARVARNPHMGAKEGPIGRVLVHIAIYKHLFHACSSHLIDNTSAALVESQCQQLHCQTSSKHESRERFEMLFHLHMYFSDRDDGMDCLQCIMQLSGQLTD